MENTSASPRSVPPAPAPAPHSATQAVFTISVAAELSGFGIQALRLYEARGLLTPARTAGGTRRYSSRDLDRLQRIAELLRVGVNLAGIGLILSLQDENRALREGDKK